MPTPYEEKFPKFIQMCEDAKEVGIDRVLVAQPWVLGDNYEEVMESLSRLAKANLLLGIAKPSKEHA